MKNWISLPLISSTLSIVKKPTNCSDTNGKMASPFFKHLKETPMHSVE
jgi:hypothetical protein